MNAINPRMGAVEWLLLVALSLIWGAAFFFAKIAISEVTPVELILLRVGIAAIALLLAMLVLGQKLPRGLAPWRALVVMGVFNNIVPYSLLFWGQVHIASGLVAMLNATTPLFSAVIAHLAGDEERLTPTRIGGVVLGTAGVALMLLPSLAANSGHDTLAEIACLGAALSYGIAGVFGRRHLRGMHPMAAATGQQLASTIIMLPVVAIFVPEIWSLRPSLDVTAAVIGLAVIGTALAYAIYFRILSTAGATNLMLVTVLVPVSAAILGAVFLRERLAPQHIEGMAVIALGLMVIDGRAWSRLRRALKPS